MAIATKGEILCVSLHGDYRYDPLKNTPEELRDQEKELQKALIGELKNTPLIVTGYMLSSYCMGGRIVEISREGDGEISNYSATPRSEQHSPPWLIAEKLGTLSVPGGNAEVFEQGKDVLTDRFIMLIKLHRHNQIRELAPLWPVVGRE